MCQACPACQVQPVDLRPMTMTNVAHPELCLASQAGDRVDLVPCAELQPSEPWFYRNTLEIISPRSDCLDVSADLQLVTQPCGDPLPLVTQQWFWNPVSFILVHLASNLCVEAVVVVEADGSKTLGGAAQTRSGRAQLQRCIETPAQHWL
eukprot:m.194056 g.194056  ORF g.194056 m.194056 type:complete len:150 (+) comp53692_c0_seq2:1981-2430(+)